VVCSTLLLQWAASRVRWRAALQRALPALGVALLVGPTPYAYIGARYNFHERVPTTTADRRRWLREQTPSLLALDTLSRLGPPPANVYLTQNGLRYDYQTAGYRVVGNVMHPGRFPDLRRAMQADTAGRFLRGFGADYLVVDKTFVDFYVGMTPPQVERALAGDPDVRLLHDDSLSAIYKIDRRPSPAAAAAAADPPAGTRPSSSAP
jgi:hypothetical protein